MSTREAHNVNFTVSDGNSAVPYTVNSTFEQSIDLHSLFGGEDQKAILISSTDGVSGLIVVGILATEDGLVSDAYTVLPLHNYSSFTYFAATHSQFMGFSGFVRIVGTESDTNVTVTPVVDIEEEHCPGSQACAAGDTCTFPLQSLEVLLLCSSLELSGTKIVSNKPLAVFSGHDCVPINGGNCEFLMEQIPPFVTWGKTFLVGPLEGRERGEIYKIVSAEADTTVSVYCTGHNNRSNLNFVLPGEGSIHTFNVGNTRRCSIRANKPVMVMLLAPNEMHETNLDGAFMSLIPPVKQLMNTVTVLDATRVTITIPASSCPSAQCSILIDNEGPDIPVATYSQPIYCSLNDVCGYSVATSLTRGLHSLRLSVPGGRMAVISYTFTSRTGYGTVAGLALNVIAGKPNYCYYCYAGYINNTKTKHARTVFCLMMHHIVVCQCFPSSLFY